MTRRSRTMAAAAALAAAAVSSPSVGAETRVGMLTCLAEAPPRDEQQTWPMACTLEPVDGKTAHRYDGDIIGLMPSARREGKALMQWAVITDGAPVEPGKLDGTFTAGTDRPTALMSEDGKLVLQAVDATQQGANVAVTIRVMKLSLPKT